MPRLPYRKHETWYKANRKRFEKLGRSLEALLRDLLYIEGVEFLTVESRAKTPTSFAGKIRRKRYFDPTTEITDLCGLRIITYLEVDVRRASDLVRKHFQIDATNSLDKSAALEVHEVGYRSVHFVCELSPERAAMPEYREYSGLRFEIQIRTVLQHAWAQIEHDRNYKLSTGLPDPLQRRLYLAAGLLEIADREFDLIAREVDEYSQSVAQKTASNDLDIDLNTPSLTSYFKERFGDEYRLIDAPEARDAVLNELRVFGLTSLKDLAALLNEERLARIRRFNPKTTDIGLLRNAMMDMDLHRYFRDAWQEHWSGTDEGLVALLSDRYGEDVVNQVLHENEITIEE
jgi:putative GTP pyrophosphokinase